MTHETEQEPAPRQDEPVVSRIVVAMAAAALAVPALIPLLVLIEPRLVPFLPAVDPSNLTATLFLGALSLVLLAVNWGFLYVIYRWMNKYGARR